ncbi:MAG: transposase [Candidatus Pacebacteria bacterium]|nr:transposase [Candidatus Paceibacterota bacterium]
MRKEPLVNEQYYHVYNRGVDKRDLFVDKHDLNRFLESIKVFNTIEPTGSFKEAKLPKNKADSDVRRPNPLVSIVCYCVNPNHFHFILKQEVEGGISEFLKRLLGGYTKYFNLMHERSGALFQGRFKSKLLDDETYVQKIYSYTHLNYLVHDIPDHKKHLIASSEREYDSNLFDIVSDKEANFVLEMYDGNLNFKQQSLEIIDIIRQERGKTSLLEEDTLP